MNHLKLVTIAATFLLSGAAHAGAPTGDACADLSAGVNQTMQDRLRASAPKQDPSSFNQDGYDIKGILSQDVTAGFSKLLSLDFSSLATSLLNKGLQQAAQTGSQQFSNKVNGVLNQYGAQSVNIAGVSGATSVGGQVLQNGANGVISGINGTVQNAQNSAANATTGVVTGAINGISLPTTTPQSIYSRTPVTAKK
jgi:type IV secretory pathway VirB6-like protein